MDLVTGGLRVDEEELRRGEFRCDPALCKNRVCCGVFDIAITFEERDRILRLLPQIIKCCPGLSAKDSPFLLTPCEIFIRKRPDGLCWFNVPDGQGRVWCGIHAAALAAGENPYTWKPLNCALWPFLRDGVGRLTLDEDASFPCLRHHAAQALHNARVDPELHALLEQLAASLNDTLCVEKPL